MSPIELTNLFISGPGSALLRPHAYLDPGSGSFILQLILASLVGIGFFFRSFWAKLFGKFRKPNPDTTEEDEDENAGNK